MCDRVTSGLPQGADFKMEVWWRAPLYVLLDRYIFGCILFDSSQRMPFRVTNSPTLCVDAWILLSKDY